MQNNFCSSNTKLNLMKAFAGECQARQRYYQAALIAQQQKYIGLERMFRFTAEQEERHAKQFFEALKECAGEAIKICADYPADVYYDIASLLEASIREEKHEAEEVYKVFSEEAGRDGFTDIASVFNMVAEIERSHMRRFEYYSGLFNNGLLLRSESSDEHWICLNCGHIHIGSEPPKQCPVCGAEQGYFIRAAEAAFTSSKMI